MGMGNHIVRFNKGQLVFRAGDAANCAYIIEEGRVALFVSQEESRIATLGKGELFGEMGVINGQARTVGALAETEVSLMIIDRAQITSRLEKSDPIIRSIMDLLLRRIRNMLNNNDHKDLVMDNENIVVAEGMHKIRFEKELFQALDDDEIINVYQPIMCLQTGIVAGFEALSRWRHPEKGMVSPFEFITLAEESDFIIPMGLKVFDSACKQLYAFQEVRQQNHPELSHLFMSINVSAAQLMAEGFLQAIKNITTKYKIDPQYIKIEITESQVVDYKKISSWMGDCKALGFKLSLDDFGTGYSGFLHLLELDFDTIKIDQTFVQSMQKNSKSLVMLEVIVEMAKRFNMKVVAEGIENQTNVDYLKSIGADYGQGYYFFKPMQGQDLLPVLQ